MLMIMYICSGVTHKVDWIIVPISMPPIDKNQMHASFKKHRAEPHVTTDEYVKTVCVTLGQHVMRRERVYLDLCFWLRLRDVILGRRNEQYLIDLLEFLRASVRAGRQICPISQATFVELFKQKDPNTRLATAKLIDELSEGVTLIPQHERIATEIAHFFHAQMNQSTYSLATLVWTKLSYVLGIQHPVSEVFDATEQRVVQKSFFDHYWGIALTDMMSMLDFDSMPPNAFNDIADRLNISNAKHAASMKTFGQVYVDEFIGGLDLAAPVAQDVLEQMHVKQTGEPSKLGQAERHASERQLFGFLRTIVKERKEVAALAFRTLHIGALCHAAIRWDQGRKLTGNDLFDFHHAEAAIAYCDIFLTEAPLQTLLLQKHVNVSGTFPCRIMSSPSEVDQYLQSV